MDAEAVNEIVKSVIKPLDVGGRTFIPTGWAESKKAIQHAKPIVVHTLSALVEYLKFAPDAEGSPDVRPIHVVDHAKVDVLDSVEGEEQDFRRQTWLRATTELYQFPNHKFGQFVPAEDFIIWLRSGFKETPTLLELLGFVVSIKESSVKETVGDLVAQEVRTARGVHFVEKDAVKATWVLKPWRTFPEIEQPDVTLSLRLRSSDDQKPHCALFEADGGTWKLTAIKSIGTFLVENCPGRTILA